MKVKVPKIHGSHNAAVLEMSWDTREMSPSFPFWNIKQVAGSGMDQPVGPSYGSCRTTASHISSDARSHCLHLRALFIPQILLCPFSAPSIMWGAGEKAVNKTDLPELQPPQIMMCSVSLSTTWPSSTLTEQLLASALYVTAFLPDRGNPAPSCLSTPWTCIRESGV